MENKKTNTYAGEAYGKAWMVMYGDGTMHILEELYVGSIWPGERTFKQNSQYSRAIKELTESEEKLDSL